MTTYHSIKRTQKRAGLSKKTSKRFIAIAIERGRGIDAFYNQEREYLLRREANEGCTAIIFDSYCFIIGNDNICITMYPVPLWFEKKPHYDGKQTIKNIKKYLRLNNSFEYDRAG